MCLNVICVSIWEIASLLNWVVWMPFCHANGNTLYFLFWSNISRVFEFILGTRYFSSIGVGFKILLVFLIGQLACNIKSAFEVLQFWLRLFTCQHLFRWTHAFECFVIFRVEMWTWSFTFGWNSKEGSILWKLILFHLSQRNNWLMFCLSNFSNLWIDC